VTYPEICPHHHLLRQRQCPLTVKHILVECSDFNDTRNKHFVASSTEELLRTADVRNILDFTKLIFTTSYDVYKHFIVDI